MRRMRQLPLCNSDQYGVCSIAANLPNAAAVQEISWEENAELPPIPSSFPPLPDVTLPAYEKVWFSILNSVKSIRGGMFWIRVWRSSLFSGLNSKPCVGWRLCFNTKKDRYTEQRQSLNSTLYEDKERSVYSFDVILRAMLCSEGGLSGLSYP